jgi:inosose dehydratase
MPTEPPDTSTKSRSPTAAGDSSSIPPGTVSPPIPSPEGHLVSGATTDRIAGAPISWGVCEVPGWGYQLSPSRVLTEMRQIGLTATEFGPEGFLPAAPEGKAKTLAHHGLQGLGGFTPVVLYRPDVDPVSVVDQVLDGFEVVGAKVLVLSADSGMIGYDARPDLDSVGWTTLLNNLDRLAEMAAGRGMTAVLHPHVGTMIEKPDDVQRVLENASISLCLDTGHLLIGGTDPAALTRQAPERIAHTHLKGGRGTGQEGAER